MSMGDEFNALIEGTLKLCSRFCDLLASTLFSKIYLFFLSSFFLTPANAIVFLAYAFVWIQILCF